MLVPSSYSHITNITNLSPTHLVSSTRQLLAASNIDVNGYIVIPFWSYLAKLWKVLEEPMESNLILNWMKPPNLNLCLNKSMIIVKITGAFT